MPKPLVGGLLCLAALGLAGRGHAAPPPEPGMALEAEYLPPGARSDEGQQPGDVDLGQSDDTVGNRRHFDEQRFHAGLGIGVGVPVGALGLYLEANVWDRLALGVGGGLGLWGPSVGGYARLRPVVWGGEGRRRLNAVTLEAGYGYMSYGGDILGGFNLMPCIDNCEPSRHHVPVPSHVGALSLGLEHALWNGFTLRYAIGGAQLLATPIWRCELEDEPVPCGAEPEPEHAFMVVSFGISHAL